MYVILFEAKFTFSRVENETNLVGTFVRALRLKSTVSMGKVADTWSKTVEMLASLSLFPGQDRVSLLLLPSRQEHGELESEDEVRHAQRNAISANDRSKQFPVTNGFSKGSEMNHICEPQPIVLLQSSDGSALFDQNDVDY